MSEHTINVALAIFAIVIFLMTLAHYYKAAIQSEEGEFVFVGALLVVLAGGVSYFLIESSFAADNEKQNNLVKKMIAAHCKQTDFLQGKNNNGVGVGVSTTGKPVLGFVDSTESDQYKYTCDGGASYTVAFDLAKYKH